VCASELAARRLPVNGHSRFSGRAESRLEPRHSGCVIET
jgi:hypothetical protein